MIYQLNNVFIVTENFRGAKNEKKIEKWLSTVAPNAEKHNIHLLNQSHMTNSNNYYKQQCTQKLTSLNPTTYAKTRNYIDGQVSWLSPYITHGLITTKECMTHILDSYTIKQAEKLLMEFLRKEFFLQVQRYQ